MEYYYHFSSLSKKLMIVLLLSSTIIKDAAGADQFCSEKAPSAHGSCKKDLAKCANELLKELVNNTPYAYDKKFTATFPSDGHPSGAFTGQATCVATTSEADCLSCVNRAKGWLSANCASKGRKGHYYYGICTVYFEQIP